MRLGPAKLSAFMLHRRILLGLFVGAGAGVTANAVWGGAHPGVERVVFNFTEPVGDLFLRLLLMMVIPLVFSSLVAGVSGMGDIRKLGRVGLKCLVYTIVISAISVVIGVGMASSGLGTTVGPPLFGQAVDVLGAYAPAWQGAALVAAAGALLALAVQESRRSSSGWGES